MMIIMIIMICFVIKDDGVIVGVHLIGADACELARRRVLRERIYGKARRRSAKAMSGEYPRGALH